MRGVGGLIYPAGMVNSVTALRRRQRNRIQQDFKGLSGVFLRGVFILIEE